MTYDAILEDELEQEKSALAIGSDALGLKHAMTKVYDENEGQFPIQDGIDLGELLNEATYHIEQTEIYAGDQMLEESLEPSERLSANCSALCLDAKDAKAEVEG